jgi:LysR family transcriptional regulator, transcription activator of glutamate synthase operon
MGGILCSSAPRIRGRVRAGVRMIDVRCCVFPGDALSCALFERRSRREGLAMNFAQLEYFLAIARTRKFAVAAEQAYVSQSSLSKQIKALEDELGVELFVRSPSGATLTPAGETFLEFAEKAFKEYESVRLRLEQYSHGAHLRIRVGALPLLSAYGLHWALSDFQVDNPDVQIDLYEREQSNLIRRLDMNQVDVAIVRTDNLSAEEYDWVPLFRDQIVAVCPATHPLARRHRVALSELRDERFVLLDQQSALHQYVVDACHRAGFAPNITFTHTRHEVLLSAVQRGLGITCLPRALAQVHCEPALVCVPLEEPIYTDVGLAFVRDRALTPWAQKLVDYLRTTHRQQPLAPDETGHVPTERTFGNADR